MWKSAKDAFSAADIAEKQGKSSDDLWRAQMDAARKYLDGCPQEPETRQIYMLNHVAIGLISLEQFADAAPIIERCLSLDGKDSGCLMTLAIGQIGQCQFDAAKRTYQKVIDIGDVPEAIADTVSDAKHALSSLERPDTIAQLREICRSPGDKQ